MTTLYHIKHPLSQKDLPEQTLATFSDQDIADYKAEFEVYKTHQHDAVREMSLIIDECRSNLKSIFGTSNDCKQTKYFERMIRSGETLTDVHAKSYPRPNDVEHHVTEARNKYCAIIGNSNSPKASGDDTLQEINNAVAFLMNKGMSLNSDFTISNAVSMAKASVDQNLNDHLGSASHTKDSPRSPDDEGWVGLNTYNLMLSDGVEFPVSSFRYRACGINKLNLQAIDINLNTDALSDQANSVIVAGEFRYEISFKGSQEPHLVIC